jgi:hypothetical protein
MQAMDADEFYVFSAQDVFGLEELLVSSLERK